MAFNVPHGGICLENNLSSVSYTRLIGVETFPLLVAVTPLGECMACVIGFP